MGEGKSYEAFLVGLESIPQHQEVEGRLQLREVT